MEPARPKPLAGSVHDSPTAPSAGTPRQRVSGFRTKPPREVEPAKVKSDLPLICRVGFSLAVCGIIIQQIIVLDKLAGDNSLNSSVYNRELIGWLATLIAFGSSSSGSLHDSGVLPVFYSSASTWCVDAKSALNILVYKFCVFQTIYLFATD
jgi:hypothetical protein